ncbi:MAG: NAD(P)-binding domain-containing protein, partial [Gemmatimonadetes bacterium]|nr:NAD(P)-binding domain-containing protein [Gemmatimonadota bacterium]NIQ58371.1 NAD(P)-binding domain-containing protein [Gemmatimonadota bacterium]NIU78587.1 NAD(P)-binding domain-containing protein [Gammaproteobacteria bacterium]NIX47427.1 NAD(P)-binding domain-containing protein [Gemmatimonadota bacterium]NIY11810.1 NAD(P)-binding domain-containing protein [Gemmatimonadota bacterium]
MRVAVVGAGAAGLASARHLLAVGMDVELLERGGEVGGVWNYGRPQGRVYRSTHTISSKPLTQFPDLPMPDAYPDYPHHRQVLEYLRRYAERFGLTEHVRFATTVVALEPEERGRSDTGWVVETDDGARARYDAVVIANGHNHEPRRPDWPGEFDGTFIHSADYRTPDLFADRRVLVVGAGNSGCDIAVEAAAVARATALSMRRGYHYVPKYLLGRPVDQVSEWTLDLRLPLPIRRWIARQAVRLGPGLPSRVGLPEPDHALLESHPIVNTLLPYYVRHGRIRPVADVARLEGDRVRLVDDSIEPVDVLVAA